MINHKDEEGRSWETKMCKRKLNQRKDTGKKIWRAIY